LIPTKSPFLKKAVDATDPELEPQETEEDLAKQKLLNNKINGVKPEMKPV